MYKDLYIKVIEYSIKRETRFKLGDLFSELDLTEEQKKIILNEVRFKKILSCDSSDYVFNDTPDDVMVWSSTEDRFRLLEYTELVEARESSKEARNIAIIAIIISIFSTASSIFISISQFSKPIILSPEITSIIEKQAYNLELIANKNDVVSLSKQTITDLESMTGSIERNILKSTSEFQGSLVFETQEATLETKKVAEKFQ